MSAKFFEVSNAFATWNSDRWSRSPMVIPNALERFRSMGIDNWVVSGKPGVIEPHIWRRADVSQRAAAKGEVVKKDCVRNAGTRAESLRRVGMACSAKSVILRPLSSISTFSSLQHAGAKRVAEKESRWPCCLLSVAGSAGSRRVCEMATSWTSRSVGMLFAAGLLDGKSGVKCPTHVRCVCETVGACGEEEEEAVR